MRASLFAAHPQLARRDKLSPANPDDVRKLAARGGAVEGAPFAAAIADFYLTNPIARASAIMAECSALADGRTALRAAE